LQASDVRKGKENYFPNLKDEFDGKICFEIIFEGMLDNNKENTDNEGGEKTLDNGTVAALMLDCL
jgi:hypothetical protein